MVTFTALQWKWNNRRLYAINRLSIRAKIPHKNSTNNLFLTQPLYGFKLKTLLSPDLTPDHIIYFLSTSKPWNLRLYNLNFINIKNLKRRGRYWFYSYATLVNLMKYVEYSFCRVWMWELIECGSRDGVKRISRHRSVNPRPIHVTNLFTYVVPLNLSRLLPPVYT